MYSLVQLRELDRDLAGPLVLRRALARALMPASAHALDIGALQSALPPALDDTVDRALDRAHATALDPDRGLALALAPPISLALERAHELGLDSALDLGLGRDRALNLGPALHLERAVTRIVLLEASSTMEQNPYWRLRWYARLFRLASWSTQLVWSLQAPSLTYSMLTYHFLGVYLGLVSLEERIEGKLPAFEGIRITKVRKAALPTPAVPAKAAAPWHSTFNRSFVPPRPHAAMKRA